MLALFHEFLIAHPLVELGVVLCVLVAMGFFAKLLKQPVLVGYIMGGVLLSPQVFDFINHQEQIEVYAHFGVSLLLFMVGLGLNPHIIREVGKVSVVAGVGQVVFTSLIGFGIALLLGFEFVPALYIAIALTFSSTIVIVKLISDRGDTSTVYGKISLGILIVQDIIAMLILIAISSTMMDVGDAGGLWFALRLLGSIFALVALVYLMTKYVIPPLLEKLSKMREIMLLFVIAWALLLGGIRYFAGFSMEIGALLAGISLASSRYRFHIFSELRPLRDFFVALFFVYLGSQVIFDNIGVYIIPVILLSLFVLIGNPFIVVALMGRLGYTRKNSFMTGLTVAQISEFSFIVIGLAITAGHIQDPMVLSVVTVIGLITMTGSSYLFAYANRLFHWLEPYLGYFEKKGIQTNAQDDQNTQIVVIGHHRIGQFLAKQFLKGDKSLVVVDHDPRQIKELKKSDIDARYGDVNDEDILQELLSRDTEWVFCTVDDYDTNRNVLRIVKDCCPQTKVVCLGHYTHDAEDLYEHGADYVIVPHVSGAEHAWGVLEQHVWDPENFVLDSVIHRRRLQEHG